MADGTSKLTIDPDELKRYCVKKLTIERQTDIADEIEKKEKLIQKREKELIRLKNELNNLVLVV